MNGRHFGSSCTLSLFSLMPITEQMGGFILKWNEMIFGGVEKSIFAFKGKFSDSKFSYQKKNFFSLSPSHSSPCSSLIEAIVL